MKGWGDRRTLEKLTNMGYLLLLVTRESTQVFNAGKKSSCRSFYVSCIVA